MRILLVSAFRGFQSVPPPPWRRYWALTAGPGLQAVAPPVKRMLPWASCPVMAQANAGLPHVVDGVTTYRARGYAEAAGITDAGVTVGGSCCYPST